jgi:integrase
MKSRYRSYRRENGQYYALDSLTGKRQSLNTSLPAEARRLLHALNEACQQPSINLQIARAYLQHADADYTQRTWQFVMDEMTKLKSEPSRYRWQTAIKDRAFDRLRKLPLIKTRAEHFLEALNRGTVSTNVYLRRIHNFALDMDWILKAVIPRRQWPKIRFKPRRGITPDEHEKIVAAEVNPERKVFYQLLWHLGGSQGDIANLKGEDVDWQHGTISFFRGKTGMPVMVRLGPGALGLLKDLPAEGLLFPYLASVRAGDRATEFRSRCKQLGIEGVSLHSYRYAWAERAKTAGMPERFAMENLGHNSKAVHRAYAKKALVKIPSLEEYESKNVETSNADNAA